MKKLIDVYPYCIRNNNVLFLVMRRSEKKIYAGQWRMIGGKVKEDETYFEAALRELKEETGLKPERFWTIPSVNTFYEHSGDSIHLIPAFAAELPADSEPALDEEHTEHRWIKAEEVADYLMWPEQQRLMRLADRILEDPENRLLPEWEIHL